MNRTRSTVSPLASLLLVIGGLALVVGIVLGLHSNAPDYLGASCGNTFVTSAHHGCTGNSQGSLAWVLTIGGAAAVLGGAAIALRGAERA